MSSQISIVERQMAMISDLQKANTAYDSENKELHAKIAKLEVHSICASVETQTEAPAKGTEVHSICASVETQTEAPAKGTKRAVFAAGTVAVIGALVVAKNPAAFKDAAVKGVAFVAEKASSVARWSVSAFFNNGIEIDLTKNA